MKRQLPAMTNRLFCVLLLAVFYSSGCSAKNEGIVTGNVTVDGKPAELGSLAFFPADGKSRSSGTKIIAGKYTANVPVGLQNVEIRVPKVVGQQKLYNTPDSPIQPIMAEVLPAKYNNQTELQLDVKPGVNEKDFILTTK